MKVWNNPVVEELNINETAQNLTGGCWDGGYTGDGHLGILGDKCTEENPCLLHRGDNDNNANPNNPS